MGGASAEWIMTRSKIPKEEYLKLAEQFNPVKFNAQEWVDLAKSAGMKYLVITSKHHDGFCLFNAENTDYDIMDATPFKRDIIKELAEECKRQEIRFGIYYSQYKDWYRKSSGKGSMTGDDYIKASKEHVRQLLTEYGDMSIIWFDTGGTDVELCNQYGELVRTLQPRSIICSRLYNRRVAKEDKKYADFNSFPDRTVVSKRVNEDAETCMTMRHNWGYDKDDDSWKSVKDIIERLVISTCRGVNFLLNVGPKPEGLLCPEEIERLKAIGKWMDVYGESIYGTTASPLDFDFSWGLISQKPGKLYLHVMKWNPEKIELYGLKSKIENACLLSDKTNLPFTQDIAKGSVSIEVPAEAPDQNDTVILLQYKGELIIDEQAKGSHSWRKTTGINSHAKKNKKK
ncbi:alpha-L-fucosidase [Verrucomicrobiota bacterium]